MIPGIGPTRRDLDMRVRPGRHYRAAEEHSRAAAGRMADMTKGLTRMSGPRTAAVTALCGLGALAVAQAGPGLTGLGPVRRRFFPRLAGQGDPGHVALTFDDGPDPQSTPLFLQALAEQQVRATFFLLGGMVERAPALTAEIVAAGHEVGVHGYDHRYLPARLPAAVRSDLRRATDVITAATGDRPRVFR